MKALVLTKLKEENNKKIENSFKNISFMYSDYQSVNQKMVDDSDIIIGNTPRRININNENLKMIQLNSAGSDRYIEEGVLHANTLLANATGIHSHAMAEHTIGMILAMNKNFRSYFANMKDGVWQDAGKGKEIIGSTVLIVGLGDIGYEIAKRLKAFDCCIIGVKRKVSEVPKEIDEVYSVEQLDEVLPRADYIISCLPHTKTTINIFNQNRFSLMKDDAFFLNIGRGSAVDHQALKQILQQGKLYAVGLDVTNQEPLPKEDELWNIERVFITPHISGGYVWKSARNNFTKLVIRNLNHFLNKEPLENEVDFTTGYRKQTTYK